MATNQQRREAAKRKLQRQNERRARQAQATKQRLTIVGVVAAVLVVVGAVWFFASRDSGKDDAVKAASGSTADAYGTDTADSAATDTAADATTGTAAPGTCAYPSDGSTPAKAVTAPTELNPPDTGTVDATLALNSGDVTLQLDRAAAPCTVNSFVSLAQQGYFDSTTCHRLTSSASLKVLQCGDPSATGRGGPGYSFADELSGSETYGAGTLAMANAGANTNGSQFFIVYGDSQLPASYTVFGKVTAGLDVVQAIAAKGSDNSNGQGDGAPKETVTIEKVTIAS